MRLPAIPDHDCKRRLCWAFPKWERCGPKRRPVPLRRPAFDPTTRRVLLNRGGEATETAKLCIHTLRTLPRDRVNSVVEGNSSWPSLLAQPSRRPAPLPLPNRLPLPRLRRCSQESKTAQRAVRQRHPRDPHPNRPPTGRMTMPNRMQRPAMPANCTRPLAARTRP